MEHRSRSRSPGPPARRPVDRARARTRGRVRSGARVGPVAPGGGGEAVPVGGRHRRHARPSPAQPGPRGRSAIGRTRQCRLGACWPITCSRPARVGVRARRALAARRRGGRTGAPRRAPSAGSGPRLATRVARRRPPTTRRSRWAAARRAGSPTRIAGSRTLDGEVADRPSARPRSRVARPDHVAQRPPPQHRPESLHGEDARRVVLEVAAEQRQRGRRAPGRSAPVSTAAVGLLRGRIDVQERVQRLGVCRRSRSSARPATVLVGVPGGEHGQPAAAVVRVDQVGGVGVAEADDHAAPPGRGGTAPMSRSTPSPTSLGPRDRTATRSPAARRPQARRLVVEGGQVQVGGDRRPGRGRVRRPVRGGRRCARTTARAARADRPGRGHRTARARSRPERSTVEAAGAVRRPRRPPQPERPGRRRPRPRRRRTRRPRRAAGRPTCAAPPPSAGRARRWRWRDDAPDRELVRVDPHPQHPLRHTVRPSAGGTKRVSSRTGASTSTVRSPHARSEGGRSGTRTGAAKRL